MPTAEDDKRASSEREVAKEEVKKPEPKLLRKKISAENTSPPYFKVFFSFVYALALASFVQHIYYEGTPKTAVLFLFHRMLGIVYCIAFVSTWVQIIGLCGENGILPATETMGLVRKARKSLRSFPTVFWISTSDRAIKSVCAAGLLASVLYTLNIVPTLALAIAWIAFLSFKVVGGEFFALQFDNLLLDVGFLAFLLPPIRFLPFLTLPVSHFYQNSIAWLVGWLGFRLMVGSGLCKITSGDKTWRNGTALCYHYWSQPMPNWISYYANALPTWFQRICCYFHFFVELAVPFGVLYAPAALPTFLLLASLQVGIILTGNYGHFNLLSILIPFVLLEDSMFPQPLRLFLLQLADKPWFLNGGLAWILNIGALGLVGLYLALSLVPFCIVSKGAIWIPNKLARLHSRISPFGILNYYGLFARMTTFRREVIVEGSNDGEDWKEYEFIYKVDRLTKHPRFVVGHLPRLDWRLWFCQFQQFNPYSSTWYDDFLLKLLQGSQEVLSLLSKDPFDGQAPRYIRSIMYDYTFANAKDRANGYWWERSKRKLWYPPCQLDEASGQLVYLMRSSLLD